MDSPNEDKALNIASVPTATLRDQRISRTRDFMRGAGIDHLLLGTADNIRYVSDYRSLIINECADHMLCILDSEGQADIYGPHVREVVNNPDPKLPNLRSLRPVSGWIPLMAEPETTIRTVANGLQQAGARHVGYDAIHPKLIEGLRSRFDHIRFTYVGNDLFDIRRRKLEAEISLMRSACQDNLAALTEAVATIRPGITDRELLATALKAQQSRNAELITHSTCNVHSDPWSWFPAGHQVAEYESIFIDQCYYGPGGYASDLTRTVFVGEPPEEVMKAYQRLVEASQIVQEAAHAGVRVSSLDGLLSETLQRFGLAPTPYGLGHGIGLRVMEPPSLVESNMIDHDIQLVAGEVIALEPETSISCKGRLFPLKVEDCFLVGDNSLTPLGPTASADGVVVAV